MNIKEIIIGATAVTSLGIGVIGLISNRKTKNHVTTLEQKVTELEKRPTPTPMGGFYTQDRWGGGFQNPQQPTAAVPKE